MSRRITANDGANPQTDVGKGQTVKIDATDQGRRSSDTHVIPRTKSSSLFQLLLPVAKDVAKGRR